MAGAITFSRSGSRSVQRLTMAWTSDAAGAVSTVLSPAISGELRRVTFTPGAGGVQPTDLYDVTLLDEDGIDVLQTKGANRSNATASSLTPLIGDGTTTNQLVPLDGQLQLVVANAGNAKQGTVTIYYR